MFRCYNCLLCCGVATYHHCGALMCDCYGDYCSAAHRILLAQGCWQNNRTRVRCSSSTRSTGRQGVEQMTSTNKHNLKPAARYFPSPLLTFDWTKATAPGRMHMQAPPLAVHAVCVCGRKARRVRPGWLRLLGPRPSWEQETAAFGALATHGKSAFGSKAAGRLTPRQPCGKLATAGGRECGACGVFCNDYQLKHRLFFYISAGHTPSLRLAILVRNF